MLIAIVSLCLTVALLFFFIYKYLALRKKYRALLQETKADAKVLFLQSKYASMGETVGNIAHQWKQPLNAIGSILNSIKAALVFQGEISKEKLLYSVDTSFKLLRHLAETIDTFYSFLSQQNNARMSFFVAEELEKVRKITEYSFENSNIALTFELEVNPTIHGNANEFTHAMLNIILNAKDAFDGVSVASPQIKVRVSEGNQRCIISVCDNAGGIRLDPLEMVFDLHITTKESGSGLGLFMTKNIIENRFGGKISAANLNQGACFTMELPYAQYGERFADVITLDEKITLERINKLSHKIIELEEVEKALKMWADIFKHARWGIAIYVEADQCFEMSNGAFESLYGYTSKEIKKLTPADFFVPECLPFFLAVQEEALKQGYAVLEARHRRKNGTTFPVSIELIVVKDETGKVLYVIFNIWDLTEQKEMQENLLLKEFALNKISEAVFLIDEKANFHYVNESACKNLQYSEEELLRMKVFDIDSNVSPHGWRELWNEMQRKKMMSLDTSHTRKDGTIFPVEINSNYFEYRNIGYNLATVRDISERLEVAKRKEDEKMRLFFERQIVGMAITSPKEGWVQTNNKLCEILGYSHEELSRINWVDITHPEDRERDLELFNKIFSGEIDDYTLEKRAIRKDKEIIYINLAVSCIRHEDGSVDYILALIEDITQRKEMENTLRESKDFQDTLLQGIADANILMSIISEGKFIYTNNIAKVKRLGFDDTIFSEGRNFIDIIHPEDKAKVYEMHKRRLAGENVPTTYEIGVVKSDGSKVEHEVSVVTIPNTNPVQTMTLSKDISERKQMEEELRNSEALYRKSSNLLLSVMESSAEVTIFALDKEYKYLTFNKLHKNFYKSKYGIEVAKGKSFIELVPDKEFAALAQNSWDRALSGESFSIVSEEGLVVNGVETIEYWNNYVSPIFNDTKEITGLTCFSINITKRREIEKKLAESHSFLNHLVDSIPDPIFVKDRDHRWIILNKANCELTGLPKEYLIGKSDYDIFPKEEADIFWEKDELVFNSKKVNINEEFFTSSDGVIHCIETVKSMFVGSDGKEYLVGTIRDITERKNAEDAVKALNETLEKRVADRTSELQKALDFNNGIINAIPDLMFEVDTQGRYLNIWAKNEQLLAAQKEVLLGNKISDVLSEAASTVAMEAIEEANEKGLSFGKTLKIDLPDGIHWFELSSSKKADGNIIFISRDITERKLAQIKMEEERQKFSKLFMSSPAAVSVTSLDRGVYLEINESFLYFTKYTREEVVGKSSADLQLFANPDERAEFFRRVLEDGIVRGYEFQYRAKDGTTGYGVAYATLLTIQGERCILAHSYDINATKQLELLNTAINNTSEAVYITDDAFSIIYVNDGACKMLGFTKEELTSMKVYEIDALCSLESLSALQQEKQLKKNIVFETKHRMKNGNIIDVEITGSYFRFHNKTVFLSVANDITQKIKDKRQIEELNRTLEVKVVERTKELQKALEFNNSIIQAIPDILFEISKEGVYLNIWARDTKLLAVQKEILLGKNLRDILPPEALEVSLKTMKEVDMFGSSLGNTYKLDLPDGEHWFELHTTKKEPEGTYLALARDITERTKAQNALLELNRTLEEKVQEGLKKRI